jgi:hypothetical protein
MLHWSIPNHKKSFAKELGRRNPSPKLLAKKSQSERIAGVCQ